MSKPPGPPPPPPARRKHERFELMAQVQIPLIGEVLILTVENISAGGVLLKLEERDLATVSLGTIVQVFLDVPVAGSDDLISLEGEADVVRVSPGEELSTIALMWSSSDAKFARTLAQILEIAKGS